MTFFDPRDFIEPFWPPPCRPSCSPVLFRSIFEVMTSADHSPQHKKSRVDLGSVFWKGGDTLKVPMRLHANNRHRLWNRFKALGAQVKPNSVILLQGGVSETRYFRHRIS